MKKKIIYTAWKGHNAVCDDIIAYAIEKAFEKYNVKISCFQGETDPIIAINNSDLYIFGGGTLLGENRIPPLNFLNQWIDKVKTPIFIFGPGFRKSIQAYDPINMIKTCLFFNKAKWHGVRGHLSFDELKKQNIETIVYGDPVLSLDVEPLRLEKYKAKVAALVVRNVPETELQLGNNQSIWEFMAQCADYLIEQGYALHFLSFRNIGSEVDSDAYAASKVIAFMKNSMNKVMIKEMTSPESAISELSKYHFILSERLHPFILGNMLGTPSMALEISFDKVKDYSTTTGFYPMLVTRADKLDFDKWKENYGYLMMHEKTVTDELIERIAATRKFQIDSIDKIMEEIKC